MLFYPPDSVKIALSEALETRGENTKVRDISVPKKNDTFNYGRLAVAASLAAIFALSSFWFYNQVAGRRR